MRVIEQLVQHFWARGALSREQAQYLVRHGFAREADLPGLADEPLTNAADEQSGHESTGDSDDELAEARAADAEALKAEELEDELVSRSAGGKAGGKKKPTGHKLAPAVAALAAHFAAREPYPALCELGCRLAPCADWRAAAQAVGAAGPESLETALVGLLNARPRALGELWFWFDLEPLFERFRDESSADPVKASLAKLLRTDTPARVGRLGQLRKAAEMQSLLDLLPARRAFLNLLPVLYHAHFPKLGQWLVPPTGEAAKCWPALPWSFVIVYNARRGTAEQPPLGYPIRSDDLSAPLLRLALTTAMTQAPVAVRELLVTGLRDRDDPEFARPLHCPFTWRV